MDRNYFYEFSILSCDYSYFELYDSVFQVYNSYVKQLIAKCQFRNHFILRKILKVSRGEIQIAFSLQKLTPSWKSAKALEINFEWK